MRNIVKILIIGSTILVVMLSVVRPLDEEPSTSTQMFCAYGRIFVEFSEGSYKWGALWLDANGRPVSCKNNNQLVEKYVKGNYDESI